MSAPIKTREFTVKEEKIQDSIQKITANTHEELIHTFQHIVKSAIRLNEQADLKDPVVIDLPVDDGVTIGFMNLGKGLTADEVLDLYVQYGVAGSGLAAELVGELGIGSKLLLGITSVFGVTSVLNGSKSVTVIFDMGDHLEISQALYSISDLAEEGTSWWLSLQSAEIVRLLYGASISLDQASDRVRLTHHVSQSSN